jgi:hypothetical protein
MHYINGKVINKAEATEEKLTGIGDGVMASNEAFFTASSWVCGKFYPDDEANVSMAFADIEA